MAEMITGATDSITLITGKPGSGKTQRVVKFCKQAVDRGEVLFVSNLEGLKLPHIPFEDPRQWKDLPAGAVLVVDEAQGFFRTRRGGEPPKYITDMETIRHHGIRLILVTQQPDYLDAHIRGLVGQHEHLVRVDGKASTQIYRHSEVMENVRSDKARGRYDSEVWNFEPELYALYESAQVHTVKRKWSSRGKRGMMMLAVVVVMVGLIVWRVVLKPLSDSRHVGESGHVVADVPGFAGPKPGAMARGGLGVDNLMQHTPAAKANFLAAYRPRIPEMPWSAPAYDKRAVKAEPELFCATFGAGLDAHGVETPASCACLTEQATRYVLPDALCRDLARKGTAYNPFQEPARTQSHEMDPSSAPSSATVVASAEGIGTPDFRGQQARYGQMRTAPIPADYEGSQLRAVQ